MAKWVKSYNPDGTVTYYRSLEDCCRIYGIKYHEVLTRMIDEAQLAKDGRTFFDYPSNEEIKLLKSNRLELYKPTKAEKAYADTEVGSDS